MKLRRLTLAPFAGFADRTVEFGSGLNVVLGANDVGKSSLFRAIDCAFFLRSKVNKGTKEGKELLPRMIPIGGDHARIAVEMTANGKGYRLEKVWGQGGTSQLQPEGGAKLAVEETVEETLRGLLPAPAATFQNVLFMGQGALEGTVAQLGREREALHSFGDLLRVTVDQSAGVSVERMRARLAEKIKAAFGHWDRAANMPEKGKGIEDPWKRDNGTILEAYYERERLRRAHRESDSLESERDRKLTALNAKQAALDEARAFTRGGEPFVRAASERAALEARLAEARKDAESLKKDLDAWLRAESDVRQFRPDVERLEPRRIALEKEFAAAVARAQSRDGVAKLERARAARSQVEDVRARLAAVVPLKPDDVKRLRAAVRETELLKSQAKSGKLQLQFHVKRDLDVLFRKDFEPEKKGTMPAGKSMTLHAGARIQIATELFELQVSGGDGHFGELEESLARAEDALGKLFAELKVKNLDEAEERQAKLINLQAELRAAEQELARALPAGTTFEALEKSAAAAQGGEGRPLEAVRAEWEFLKVELDGKKKGLTGAESVLHVLRERTGLDSAEKITGRLLERNAATADLEKQRAALPELPASLGKLEDFLPRFREAQLAQSRLADEIGALKVEIAELKAKLPEQSAQDLERAAREAAALFDRELARGRALVRVDEAIRALESGGGDLYAGFRSELEKQVSALSRGKYGRADLTDALPALFERRDGVSVPYDWLSAGTKDAFALALRLAMASHFLGASDGFLLIDDPLVNMDPERQKTAAAMLCGFAADKQVVVFTCHPAHAELLGGNRIELA
jgi:exonuclease SbcC